VNGPRITVIPGTKHVNDKKGPQTPLELNHRVLQTGEAAVAIAGELDIDTADTAFGYVRMVINRHRGPVVVSLAGVRFCDARGLYALVRMANHAEQADCPFGVTSPSPMMIRLMRTTGLDGMFLAAG
jgi:anti-sigma B factor antagonist